MDGPMPKTTPLRPGRPAARLLEARGLAALRARFRELAPIDDADWRMFVEHVQWGRLEPQETFARPGELATRVGFVVEGVFRMAYDRADGRTFTKSFVAEGDFIAAADSLASGEPTRMRIEALSRAVLLCVSAQIWSGLFERSPRWERVGRRMAEQLFAKKIQREASLLMDTPSERYRRFVAEFPKLEARVPGYLVASYLGIAPETLSRLRRARVRRRS
jgi:CRP-like cAMP-binding protein